MATTTAFESITTRLAWYANEAVAKYDATMYDTDGQLAKADGSGPFAGICQYGGNSGDMVTVVRGIFPGVLSADGLVGAKLTLASGADAGKFKTAIAGDKVYGVLLYAAKAGDLAAVSMVDVYTLA